MQTPGHHTTDNMHNTRHNGHHGQSIQEGTIQQTLWTPPGTVDTMVSVSVSVSVRVRVRVRVMVRFRVRFMVRVRVRDRVMVRVRVSLILILSLTLTLTPTLTLTLQLCPRCLVVSKVSAVWFLHVSIAHCDHCAWYGAYCLLYGSLVSALSMDPCVYPMCLLYSCLVSAVPMVSMVVCGVYSDLCMVSWSRGGLHSEFCMVFCCLQCRWCPYCPVSYIVSGVFFHGVCSTHIALSHP